MKIEGTKVIHWIKPKYELVEEDIIVAGIVINYRADLFRKVKPNGLYKYKIVKRRRI